MNEDDSDKHLRIELKELRQRVADLEAEEHKLRQAEEALRQSEEYSATILNHSPSPMLLANPDSSIRYVNPAFEAITGFSLVELIGRKAPYPWWTEETLGKIEEGFRQAFRQGVKAREEFFKKRTGERFWVEVTGAPVIINNEFRYYLASWTDITERRRAEEALQLRAHLLNEATDSIIATDLDGNIIYMNEATCRTRGYSKEEMLNMNLKQLVPPEIASSINEMISRVKKEGSIVAEAEHVRKDGATFPVEATARALKLGDKTIILSVIRDITERKKVEMRVMHLNRVLEVVRNVNQLITHETDREHLIHQSCQIIVENRGYDLAWILLIDEHGKLATIAGAGFEQKVFTKLHEELKKGHYPPSVNELLTKKEAFSILGDAKHQFKNPALANAFAGGYAFADRLEFGGRVYGIIMVKLKPELALDKEEQDLFHGLVCDIAYGLAGIEWEEERKRAVTALRESEEMYRTLLELGERIGEAVVMLQDDERGVGMHNYASDEWCRITGYSQKELLNMSMADLIHPDDREKAVARHSQRMRGETLPGLYEITIMRKDGTEVPVEVTYAYSSYKGKPANVGYIRDISERKKMEEQLIVTDRLASIGELASGVAHELNNPLTGIIGFSELLLKKDVPDDVREDLKIINREAQRTAQVVRNLLTFARRHDTAKKPVDINKAIKSVLDLRAYEQKVHNIEVVTNFDPSLPEITADIFRLQQVFVNIIINAEYFMVQAHGKGRLTITTERKGSIIRTSFTDDGPGIDEEHLRHLFDPFFTTKEVGKGTGLGLSICHGIVTEHGGHIYAQNNLNKGATFIVDLPIK